MAEEEMVTGDGWISDESSFYGDEYEQQRLHSLCDKINPKPFWRTYSTDLNVVVAPARAELSSKATPITKSQPGQQASLLVECTATSESEATSRTSGFLLDRRAMEEERLSRLGQRKRGLSPPHKLFNPAQGHCDAWQLGESVNDFVRRLPPLSTSVVTCPWIWVHNPHPDLHAQSTSHCAEEFSRRGMDLLDQSLRVRQELQARFVYGSKAVMAKSLNQESKALQQRVTDLAAECGILSGKWMLFPKLEEVTQVWKKVVEGIVSGRLGPTAKVATDEGKPNDRLVCIYTKDFRDENDVLRVLQELNTMGLLHAGRSIYYKSDAYTYLNLYKQTAAEYGLQASLYNSFTMMAAGRHSKVSAMPQKKQSTLNNYF